ncbi:cytochrome d oxidase cyd, subunit II [Desulfosporosinus orientis DSM 765]|uniref:Cytochrome d oxidase cyd, subunit II n=1 Tax=Desulfosporosinus orientis (strain ATCC 19365 / DSM 765 / NCIMB 8382 / VKM B-1628 / Singapore I) TaxID=768706 RepID=G7WDB8_DESOD|nr:cytochrome d ubiquinol oxidase subunit II [Desulfosporosinus orientis]AET67603.1 cytochrome d oxidase cyd, subunit II [Desulfosporosinus orientis DSM 765]
MDLNILWFILIAVLFVGFFFLEGFDFGVGILLPFLGRNDQERRVVINTIGPHWDGNEVWLITAGGAMFAAFPNWYATLFSGFFLALFLVLFSLIIRGVAFEYRSSDASPRWRSTWDWVIFTGSLLLSILWGVAMTNLIKGVPIDAKMQYAGTFFDLLSPYTIVGGLTTLLVFMLHGALFLSLKTTGTMAERSSAAGQKIGLAAIPVVLLFAVLTYLQTDLFASLGAGITLLASGVTLILAAILLRSGKAGWAFITNGLTILLFTLSLFWGLFPRVMISSLNMDWSLTIYNASSSPYTLKIMTIVAIVMVPIVLLYQGWTYWVFRNRVTEKNLHY